MLKITVNNHQVLEIEHSGSDLVVNGKSVQIDAQRIDAQNYHILHNNRSYSVELVGEDDNKNMQIKVNGNVYSVAVKDQFDLLLKQLGLEDLATKKIKNVNAPMPGLVLGVSVTVGQEIKKGDNLLVLEAMKMENILKSPSDGKIAKINIAVGDKVEKNAVLIEFE